jgi:hypothetical protein
VVGRVDVETVHGNASVGSVRSVARDTVVGEFAVVVREPIPIDHRDGRRRNESDAHQYLSITATAEQGRSRMQAHGCYICHPARMRIQRGVTDAGSHLVHACNCG